MTGGRYFRARDAAALQKHLRLQSTAWARAGSFDDDREYVSFTRWALVLGILALFGSLRSSLEGGPLP